MDASDPDPGPQEREMNCRPAVGSENCGPVIIVFEGREGAPLLAQAADTAQTVPGSSIGWPSRSVRRRTLKGGIHLLRSQAPLRAVSWNWAVECGSGSRESRTEPYFDFPLPTAAYSS